MDEQRHRPLLAPAREVPVPAHLSPHAQNWLGMPPRPRSVYPAIDDTEGWNQFIAASDDMIARVYLVLRPPFNGAVREVAEGEARGFEIIPEGVDPSDRRVYLDIHGGGLIMGGGELCKLTGSSRASKLGVRVFSPDYRMPPDHPYPAGLDDCLAFYRMLLRDRDPVDVIVGGGSAGSNLVAAMILRARDEGLPLPAAAVLISPEADLTETGDSFYTNDGIDAMGSLMGVNLLYAAGHPLDDPYISPLFGDFTKGFPPTLITAGTRDLFLSNAVRMHRKLRSACIPA